jgi:hypothetical protein
MFNRPFCFEVALVSNDHDEGLLAPDLPYVVDPLVEVGERDGICMLAEILVMSKTMMAALESLM